MLDDLLEDWEADAAVALGRARAAADRAPLLGRGARHPRLPGAQRRALPLARRRRPRGAHACWRPPAATGPSCPVLVFEDGETLVRPVPGGARRAGRPAHRGRAALLRPRHRRRRAGRAGGGGLRRLRGPARRCSSSATRPAGRPAQSSRIENYLGFPSGLSGADLARRATAQARRLGAEMLTAREVVGIRENGPSRVVALDGDEEIGAHSVLVATGVHYARLEAPGRRAAHRGGRLLRRGARREAAAVEGEDVVVVGAANSAGQAAIDLATRARHVTMLCRGDGLERRACPTTWSSGSTRCPTSTVRTRDGGRRRRRATGTWRS